MNNAVWPQWWAPNVSAIPPRPTTINQVRKKRLLDSIHVGPKPSAPWRRTRWRRAPPTLHISAPIIHNLHSDLWQEASPADHTRPHCRPPHKHRLRPRPVPRSKSKIRWEWSTTLSSAYHAARTPFHITPSQTSRHPVKRLSAVKEAQSPSRNIEVAGPLIYRDSVLLRQRLNTASFASPLASNPPPFVRYGRYINMANLANNVNESRRSAAARKRDSFNRAKIHVRRPPKGVQHWFDALDDDSSDNDYPEVATEEMTAFQPSLGPRRARAAPTSFISSTDYFSYSYDQQSAGYSVQPPGRVSRMDRSVLELSSDEDETERAPSAIWERNMPPSPSPHARRPHSQRPGSATPLSSTGYRQSMASMQTTFTSATIPFMLNLGPMGSAPPLPHPARDSASYLALTGLPVVADSKAPQINSRHSQMNYVAVTSEEMAVLEMMRRKRAAQRPDTPSIAEAIERPVAVPSPLNPTRIESQQPATDVDAERSHSMSSTVTLESGENITFPAPPVPSKTSRPRKALPFIPKALPATPSRAIAELDGTPSTSQRNKSISSTASRRTSNFSLLHPHAPTPADHPAFRTPNHSTSSSMDFSEIRFASFPNLLSPSVGGMLTAAREPGPEWRHLRRDSDSSPSLTDAGSVSGHSRSEVDTPVKETQPGIYGGKMRDEVVTSAEHEVLHAWRGLGGQVN